MNEENANFSKHQHLVIKLLFRIQHFFFFIKGSERRASLYHQIDKKDDKPFKKGKKNLRKQCTAAARRFLSLCSSSASAIRASLACGY